MQFVLFLFDVNTVDTRNRKCIRLNGTNVDTVDTVIDTCIHVHVFILVVLAFYTGLWMLQ